MQAKIKEIYEKSWAARKHQENYAQRVEMAALHMRREGDRVLDVGCGGGALSVLIKENFTEVYGVDILEDACSIAAQKGVISQVVDLNAEAMPYNENFFDVVVCLDIIEHVLDPLRLLADCQRVLKYGGQFLLSTPNIRYFRHVINLIVHGRFPHTSGDTDIVWGGGHLYHFCCTDTVHLLKRAGFKRISLYINECQFKNSRKRKVLRAIIGEDLFREFFCAGIFAEAFK